MGPPELGRRKFAGGSVFLRQKQGGARTVRFGDDPQLISGMGLVAAQKPETMLQAELILTNVVILEFTPISANVAHQKLKRALARSLKSAPCSGSRGKLAQRKESSREVKMMRHEIRPFQSDGA